jgi:hypothetical protein
MRLASEKLCEHYEREVNDDWWLFSSFCLVASAAFSFEIFIA